MADLIDREELLLILKKNDEQYWNSKGGGYAVSQDIIDEIRFMPKVDTERHAHWEQPSYFDEENNVFQCSNCKEEFVLISGSPKENEYEYCPHCGCKMEEVTNNDN